MQDGGFKTTTKPREGPTGILPQTQPSQRGTTHNWPHPSGQTMQKQLGVGRGVRMNGELWDGAINGRLMTG